MVQVVPSKRFGRGGKEISKIQAIFPSGRELKITSNTKLVTNNTSIYLDDSENLIDNINVKEITTETRINNGKTMKKHYDNTSKILTSTSLMGKEEKVYFNDKGRVIKVESSKKANGNSINNIADINYEYDNNGRIKKISQKDRFIEFTYNENGYLSMIEDNEGNIEESIYDEAGRVILTRTNADSSLDPEAMKYEYDKNNNPIKVTPEEGKEHDFSYDLVDRVKSYSSPKVGDENNVTSYNYNLDGQGISMTSPDTKRIEYNYNDVTAKLESINYVALQPPKRGVDSLVKIINYVYL